MHLFVISGEFIGGLTSWGSRAISLPKKAKHSTFRRRRRLPSRGALLAARAERITIGLRLAPCSDCRCQGVTGCVPEKLEARYVGALRHLWPDTPYEHVMIRVR